MMGFLGYDNLLIASYYGTEVFIIGVVWSFDGIVAVINFDRVVCYHCCCAQVV